MELSWAMRGQGLRAAGAWGLCLVAIGIGGCEGRTVPIVPVPIPEVTVAQPLQREIVETREYPGRVAAVESVEIRARVTGYLIEVNFIEGDIVEAGAVLFKIDPRPFQESLNAAKADIDRWTAVIAKNEADLDRQTRLLKSGAGLQEDYDQSKALVLEAKAALSGAQAEVEKAQLNLEFTTITAPVKGRVGRALVTKGNLVTADQTLGTPLTTLVSVDPMYVYFDVDEFTVLEVQRQSRMRDPNARNSRVRDRKNPIFIELANEKGFPHEGFIDFVDNQVDSATGTWRVRGEFENKNEYLTPGLFVKVRVPLGKPEEQFLVPQTAVGTDLNQKFVLVVDAKNIVLKKPVELGPLTDDGLQVVDAGLSAEDWVIINGLQRTRDGGTVQPKKGVITPFKMTTQSDSETLPAGDQPADKTPAADETSAETPADSNN